MFIAALFTIAKLWNQPRCPSTNVWIKKCAHTHTLEYYSAIKNKIMSFAGKWMELEIINLNKLTTLRKTNSTCSFSHAESSP
jgi:hypothetical protein